MFLLCQLVLKVPLLLNSPIQFLVLPKDQYSQLMLLLQQSQLFSSVSSTSSTNYLASTNFAGELLPHKVVSYGACMLTKICNVVWVIDSRESDHMTSLKHLLFNIQTLLVHYLVSLPNGYKVKVTNIGSLTLFPDLILHNVLHFPSFQFPV